MAVTRQHPFFSSVGCLTALVIVAGLGLAVWFTGGAVFSPGPLTAKSALGLALGGFASHAEFENDCAQCHAPFRGVEAARCENCHAGVLAERTTETGLHGGINVADVLKCAACHADHKGRDFNPSNVALASFDHAVTGFALTTHQQTYEGALLTCQTCHIGEGYSFARQTCTDCHSQADAGFMAGHVQTFGDDCLSCHDGTGNTANFDHARFFPLEGAHAAVECAACHVNRQFKGTPTECVACHVEPEVHLGLFGTDCAACHTTTAWLPALLVNFDHSAVGFALTTHQQTYEETPFTCQTCHTGDGFAFAQQACVDCHSQADAGFMAGHVQTFGDDCLSCHDGTGNTANFDHARFFSLEGAHATAECAACHVNRQFKGTPTECVACHAEPEVHAGLFGVDCAACHSTSAWQPATLANHTFPLDHGKEGIVPCATCHPDTYQEYTCYGCHKHEPAKMEKKHAEKNIVGARLLECAACHPDGKEKIKPEGDGDD